MSATTQAVRSFGIKPFMHTLKVLLQRKASLYSLSLSILLSPTGVSWPSSASGL